MSLRSGFIKLSDKFDEIEFVPPCPNLALEELRDVVLHLREYPKDQNFIHSLSFIWSFFQLSRFAELEEAEKPTPLTPDECVQSLAMQYLHALHAEYGFEETIDFDEQRAANYVNDIAKLVDATRKYIFALTLSSSRDDKAQLKMRILTNWAFVRGRRYTNAERDFFAYVLAPHNEALSSAFGVTAQDIANEFSSLANLLVHGTAKAMEVIHPHFEEFQTSSGEYDFSKISQDSRSAVKSAIDDMLFAGVFNVTKHSSLPVELLDELSYSAGASSEFFEGEYGGTPLGTFPSMIRPLIKVGDNHFHTDPKSLFDSGYRSIERALKRVFPAYRESWNKAQAKMCEHALLEFSHAYGQTVSTWREVYYKDSKDNWCEADLVIQVDDLVLVCEAKAGSYSLRSPGENVDAHIASLKRIVVSACNQSFRFIDALESRKVLHLFHRADGKYQKVGELNNETVSEIVPVGVSVESLAPHTKLIDYEDIPQLRQRGFVFLSVDDLMILTKFLPSLGAFCHYMTVRCEASKRKHLSAYDEMDHLGLYIAHNRYDMIADEQSSKSDADLITFDGYDSNVGDVMMHPDYPDIDFPTRTFPDRIQWLLNILADVRPAGWRSIDAYMRDLSTDAAEMLSTRVDQQIANLDRKPYSFGALKGDKPLIIVFINAEAGLSSDFCIFMAKACLHSLNISIGSLLAMEFSIENDWNWIGVRTVEASKPGDADYHAVRGHAANFRFGS